MVQPFISNKETKYKHRLKINIPPLYWACKSANTTNNTKEQRHKMPNMEVHKYHIPKITFLQYA